MLLFLGAGSIHAQMLEREVIAAWGDFSTAGGYSLSATMGEPMAESFLAAAHHLTQGFQQPTDEATIVTTLPDIGKLEVYPNPASEIIFIHAKVPLDITMFDVLGQRIEVPVLKTDDLAEIHVGALSGGTYILSCTSKTGEIQRSIKVIVQ